MPTKNKKTNKLARVPRQEVAPAPSYFGEAERLISKAIDNNVPVETMEKLMAMRRELKQEWAKEEYDKAMAKFQAEAPVIKKTEIVRNKDNSERYRFAPIDSIVSQVKVIIEKHGFSYAINSHMNGGITIICKVTHRAGHSEVSEFSVPINKDAYMNDQQKIAAAATFAKRYAFCNAFGILTGDGDNDANLPKSIEVVVAPKKPAVATPGEILTLRSLMKRKGKAEEDFLKFYGAKSLNEIEARYIRATISKLTSLPEKEVVIPEDEVDVDAAAEGIEKQRLEKDKEEVSTT